MRNKDKEIIERRDANSEKLTIHEIVHDLPQCKAAVYALSTGKTPFGDWTNEYAVFFTFNKDGQEIVKVEEMVDTAFMNEFFPKFQEYMRRQATIESETQEG